MNRSTLPRRAGLADPKPDWTYYDFVRMAKKLTVRDHRGSGILPESAGSTASVGGLSGRSQTRRAIGSNAGGRGPDW